MPTKATEGEAAFPSQPMFAGPLSSTSSGVGMRVPRECGPWTFCVNPIMLRCLDGHIVPRLAKAWWTTGLNGNGRMPNRGQGFLTNLQSRGFTIVPHGMECNAFDVDRKGGTVKHSTYLTEHRGQLGQRNVSYWTDAWTKSRSLGPMTVWDRDKAGWLDFLQRCLRMVWGDKPLDEVQIQLAVAPLLRQTRAVIGVESSHARRVLDQCLSQLPSAHVPRDLAGVYRDWKGKAAELAAPLAPLAPAIDMAALMARIEAAEAGTTAARKEAKAATKRALKAEQKAANTNTDTEI